MSYTRFAKQDTERDSAGSRRLARYAPAARRAVRRQTTATAFRETHDAFQDEKVSRMTNTLTDQIKNYLSAKWPDTDDLDVTGLRRIYGGSSKETYRFIAEWSDAGERKSQQIILRREPEAGLVVSEDELEFTVYKALEGRGLAVPRAFFFESDPSLLGRPFCMIELLPGVAANPFAEDAYGEHEVVIARQFWRDLGSLAAIDTTGLALETVRGARTPDGVWTAELDHWEKILKSDELLTEPIVWAAIRWLRNNPPPAPKAISIVHGDYRSGNFLYTEEGKLSAILDWEMCHLGDPLEDIAWAINPFWTITRHLPLEEGLAIWEEASGLPIDREALAWWRLFAAVKACVIWTTGGASFARKLSQELMIVLSYINAGHFHRSEILSMMREKGVF